MSSTSNVQNVLANVVRPVYTYDPATSNYVAKVIISNVDTFSVRTIEVENLEFGDANRNLYLGVDAGSTNSNSASNVAIGYGAAENNINTKNSVFVGYTAGGENITDASASVVLGANTRSGGSSNVYIGYGTGLDSNTASGNIFVGPGIVPANSVSNEVRIGKDTTIPFYANLNNGYTGINTILPNYELDVSADTTNLRGTLRVVGHAGGNLESAQPSAVELGDGDDATGSTGKSTVSLQYYGGGYRHFVRTRHNASSNFSKSNGIDLFVNNSGTAGGSSAPGVGNVLALSATAAGVGIGRQDPSYALDVSGTIRAAGILTTGGSSTFGDVILGNGTVSVLDGSAAAPSYTFQNDTSLGLFRTSTSALGVTTAGLERLRVDSNGRVGIGLTNPSFAVDVSGTVRATAFIGTTGAGSLGGVSFNSGAVAVADGTVSVPTYTFQNDLSLGLYRQGTNTLAFASAGSNRMTLSNENLGIGTTAPAYTLDVSGTTQSCNAIVSGYLRNALAPTQFDISGGNISNSGTTTTANLIASGYLRNALAPTQFDISGGTLFLSNRLLTGAGTVSAPSHTFANDASMGLYDPATNVLGIVTAGVERMRVGATGLVGIATTTPQYVLDVSAGAGSAARVYGGGLLVTSNNSLTSPSGMRFIVDNSDSYIQWGSNTTASGFGTTNLRFTDINGATERMRITSNGNVGIGTASPASRLDVSSSAATTATLRNTTGQASLVVVGSGWADTSGIQLYHNSAEQGLYGNTTNIPLYLWTNNARRLTITSGGIVGIGTTSPAGILDVRDVSATVRICDTTNRQPTLELNRNAGGTFGASSISDWRIQVTASGGNYQLVRGNTTNTITPFHVDGTSGNVGIGTTSPTNALDVSASGTVTAQFRNTSAQAGVRVTGSGFTDGSGLLLYHSSTAQGLFASNLVPLQFSTNSTTRVTIDSSGAVGIGLTNPSTALNTAGLCVAGNIRMGTTTTDYRQFVLSGGNSLGYIYGAFAKYGDGIHIGYNFHNNNTSNVIPNASGQTSRISMGYGTIGIYTGVVNTEPTNLGYYQNSNGNVGIGTTSPTFKLDVQDASAGLFRIRDTATNNPTFEFNRSGGTYGTGVLADWRLRVVQNGGSFQIARANTSLGGDAVGLHIEASTGTVGIGTTAPATALDVCATNQVVTLTSTATTSPTPIATVYQPNLTTTSPSNYTYQLFGVNASSSNAVGGLFTYVGSGSASNSYRIYIQGSAVGGITLRANGNVGIGTTAPAYALDVSAAPTTASVNMTSWPRTTMATTFYGVFSATAGTGNNCITWTTSNSIDSNIITVASNTGTYFTINRSGVYAFNLYVNGTTAGTPLLMIDCSTNIAHDNPNANTIRQLAYNVGSSGVGQLSVSYVGFLPSNSGIYYKAKVVSLTPNSGAGGARLTISFLGETPAVTSFPF